VRGGEPQDQQVNYLANIMKYKQLGVPKGNVTKIPFKGIEHFLPSIICMCGGGARVY
jgi:hypothetical protein